MASRFSHTMGSVKSFSWPHFPYPLHKHATRSVNIRRLLSRCLSWTKFSDCLSHSCDCPGISLCVCSWSSCAVGSEPACSSAGKRLPLGNPCFHSPTHSHPSQFGQCRTGQTARARSCPGPFLLWQGQAQIPFHILARPEIIVFSHHSCLQKSHSASTC